MTSQQYYAAIANIMLICSTFVSHFFTCGFATSIGVFHVEFLSDFQYSSGVTSWVGSINYAMLCLVGPLASWISTRYGCHICMGLGGILSVLGLTITAFSPNIFVIFVSLGFITGAGFGLAFSAGIFVINLNITKWRALSTGLSMSGIGLGTTVHPLLSNYLIREFGWRGAMLFTASMVMHVCLAAEFVWIGQRMVTRHKIVLTVTSDGETLYKVGDNNNQNHQVKKDTVKSNGKVLEINKLPNTSEEEKTMLSKSTTDEPSSMWHIPMYWALQVNTILYSFGQSVIFTHIAAFATVSGQSFIEASSNLSAIGISCLFGRILLGLFAQHRRIDTGLLFCVCYFTAGVSTICYSIWANYWYMLTCMIVLGFCLAAYGPLLTEVLFQTVKHRHFSSAYGFIMCFSAAGTFLGAPCAGWLYDITQHYQNSFYLGGASFILSTLPVIICKCMHLFVENNKL